MQLKPITSIIVLLLLVASLSVAGCTISSNTPTTTPTTANSPDPLVQKIIDNEKGLSTLLGPVTSIVWSNDTTATITYTNATNKTETQVWNITIAAFPTIDAASSYFDSLSGYYPQKVPLDNLTPMFNFKLATGHDPTTIRQANNELYGMSITQEDNIVCTVLVQFPENTTVSPNA